MRAGPNSTVGEVSHRERFDNETLSRPRDNTGTDLGDRQDPQGCLSRGLPSETAQLPASGTPAQRLGPQPAGSCPAGCPAAACAEPALAPRIAPAGHGPVLAACSVLPASLWKGGRAGSSVRVRGQGFTRVAEPPAWLEVANMFGRAAPGHSRELVPGNR